MIYKSDKSGRLRSSAREDEYENTSTRHQNRRRDPYHCRGFDGVLAFAIAVLTPTASNAYTAAGDRNFPAQLVLPQIGPTDALWVPISTQPMEAVKLKDPTRETVLQEFTAN